MALTKAQRTVIERLLDECKTLQCYLDDANTGYPQRSRQAFDEAIASAERVFAVQQPLNTERSRE